MRLIEKKKKKKKKKKKEEVVEVNQNRIAQWSLNSILTLLHRLKRFLESEITAFPLEISSFSIPASSVYTPNRGWIQAGRRVTERENSRRFLAFAPVKFMKKST